MMPETRSAFTSPAFENEQLNYAFTSLLDVGNDRKTEKLAQTTESLIKAMAKVFGLMYSLFASRYPVFFKLFTFFWRD